jgi:RHS repeat-associated protein
VVTWLFEPGGFVPAAKLKGDRQYSVLADHLGTPTRVHDAEGGLVWHMTLDAYGRETCLKGEAGTCPFRYQGQYADPETGLYYNRFRYYDPADGRYISPDPIGLASGELGMYNYVPDPNGWVDVFGLAGYQPKKGEGKRSGEFKFPGTNPAKAPKGFVWKGRLGSTPGSKDGNWYNPKTGESLRPDLNHPEPIGPHWDYKDPSGKWWRIFQDGSNVPK